MKYISMVKETCCISAWPWNILNFQEKENVYKLQGKSLYPRGVLGISSDGDDQRIFLGLKFSIPGFFWVWKFGLGNLIDLSRDFLGVLKRIPVPQGGTRNFKWRGWSKDFLGFEIFDSGIFLGTKIWLR